MGVRLDEGVKEKTFCCLGREEFNITEKEKTKMEYDFLIANYGRGDED